MTQIPVEPLVPNNTLITRTAEEGRALAIILAQRRGRSHRRKRTPGPRGPGVLAMIGC